MLLIRLLLLFIVLLIPSDAIAAPVKARKPNSVCLLEDNAESLLQKLTNPTGDPGKGDVEKGTFYSGDRCIRITPMQRFHPGVPGWKFRICKYPKPGEYRYLRFAWKADGCQGIMIQFHDATNWNLRYTAGRDAYNWGSKFVADHPPAKWTVVTRDLYADFGDRTLQGIALTAFGGRSAHFDHIYLARTIDGLDRIDATGVRSGKTTTLSDEQLESLWRDLASADAPAAYLAFWRLVAAPNTVAPFLQKKLTAKPDRELAAKISKWIRDLDDKKFRTRAAASRELLKHLEDAVPMLEKSLTDPSAEVRERARQLLSRRKDRSEVQQRVAKAIRALEYMETDLARKCLAEIAGGNADTDLGRLAKSALERLQ